MTPVKGGVTAPKGFRAAGVAAGLKRKTGRNDCALIVSGVPATVAGTFTRNRVKAAPVRWCERICAQGEAQAIFVNSGNANACTGAEGDANVAATARLAAERLGIAAEAVCVCSTGVIGVQLPMDKIFNGIDLCVDALSDSGSADAAAAIMTTDTVPKERAIEIPLSGGTVRLGGISKGAGMTAPNMATTLTFLTTDAAIAADDLTMLLREAVRVTFNRMCVDNDTSTNDTLLCLANGQAGLPPLEPGTPEYAAFAAALTELCGQLARMLVEDGEGATKLVEIAVEGAQSDEDAETAARAIAQSQLCKTAFFGEDPNWGRFACAAGYSGAHFDPDHLDIWIDDLQIMAAGGAVAFDEAEATARMKHPSFCIRVRLGDGPGHATFWTSDLSYDYVRINAAYRT